MEANMDFSHLSVTFYTKAIENKAKSAEKGRAIFDEVEMVRIVNAGDNKTEYHTRADDPSSVKDPVTNQRLTYAQLHFGPYEAFKRNQEYVGEGTPIDELPFVSMARAEELKRVHIHTAEALAGLDGKLLQDLGMDGRQLKEQAEAYLSNAAGVAETTRLSAENADMKSQIEELKAAIAQISGGKAEAPAAAAEPDPDEVSGKYDISSSPFKDWAVEDISNWIVDNGGASLHHRTGLEKAIRTADALNAKLKKENEAA